ncbi:MAG: lysophospholipid acyltransferase family protein [Pseudomonadales bacterium]|nr:lysophospholipid acyltransferase family protein [Pseudomonadales bacterium]
MWGICRLLPVTWASALGAALFGAFGPGSHKQRHVLKSMSVITGSIDDAVLRPLAIGMWANLGRVIAEYPHITRIAAERTTVTVAAETRALLDAGETVVILAGHIANWEIIANALENMGVPLIGVYARHANPYIEKALRRFRHTPESLFVNKGDALSALLDERNAHRSFGVLPDQRAATGLMLPFFGIPAKTTIIPARIAMRSRRHLVPVQVERLAGTRFRLTVHAPLTLDAVESRWSEKRRAIRLTEKFQALLETWIAAHPEHWLCTKHRWPKRD